MEFRTLGPLQVVDAGRALTLGGALQRAVLALLVVDTPEPVSVDRLIDELWGERPPASAQHAIQVYVSAIRKLLRTSGGEVSVRTTGSAYALETDPDRVDAKRFGRLLAEAQQRAGEDPERASQLFGEALGLWRGPPLAEFAQFAFALREADRLEELRTTGLEGLVEARLSHGEHAEVLGMITGLVASNPLRERPRRLLMLALYRSGRHAEALDAYRDACTALDEIGLQPGPELRQLEAQILRHDSSLALPGVTAHAAGVVADPLVASGVSATADGTPAGGPPGSESAPGPGPRQARKVVTALFCDVAGSTALGESLDPEALHRVMKRLFAELRGSIERHGGKVEKFIGDEVVAVFGIPRVHEDDALRAVRAAAEIAERLPAVAAEVGVALSFRAAVNTGLVLVGEGESVATGDAINVAARIEQAAAPGEILLGEATLRLVRDAVEWHELEPLALKGKSAPVRAFRLIAVNPLAAGLARHLDAPLVGRERELAVLRGAWDRAVRESGCHLFTLLGVAGVGKSRLVAELLASLGETSTPLRGRCLHYGEGITFWPLIEALTPLGEPAAGVLLHLRSGGTATPEELFFEVRQLLESVALQRPVIVHVDDLQWAESMLMDLLDHVADLSRGAPILLLCSARAELLEQRPAWGGGKLNATTLLLEPLDASECETLLEQLGGSLAPDTRARVITASDGNPLFLEEMVALAAEPTTTVTVPPTIQALLAARLDSIPIDERELLERGAIEGEVFHRRPLHSLTNDHTTTSIDTRLARLVRKELIRPHPSMFKDDDAFRFRHLLIRDAAYDGLPKASRARLHEQFADWLEQHGRELSELDEITGWHLEQSLQYQRELGGEINLARVLDAAQHLHTAGRRAGTRGDVAAAMNLLERALALAPANSSLRASVCVDLAERLVDTGDLARVDELLLAAERDPDTADLARLTRFDWTIHTEPQGAFRAIEAELPALLARLEEAGDARGLAKAHMVAYQAHWLASRATAASEELRLAAEHARAAGDGGLRARALAQYVLTLLYGDADAATLAREIGALEGEDLGVYLSAFVDLGRGELRRLAGDFDAARELLQGAIDRLGLLGMGAVQGGLEQDLGQLELSAGDPQAAVAALLRSDAILARVGAQDLRSTTQALLADAYEQAGQRESARGAIELTNELSAAEDLINYVSTYMVRARLALADGDRAAAESWARSASEYARQIDMLPFKARMYLQLAPLLSVLEHHAEAVIAARTALNLYQAKGDNPGIARASALLSELHAFQTER